jgi:ABC-type sugar transport system permease subunit
VISRDASTGGARLAWLLAAPALLTTIAVVAGPIAWTAWESLHLHDLRMPWLGRPFVGAANYAAALEDPRFRAAVAHTAAFTAVTVAIETVLGLFLALALNGAARGRGLLRTAVLLPWAIPTVVAALVWRFMFDRESGIASAIAELAAPGRGGVAWLADPWLAWVPIVLADVWKMTPFMAVLLLAGLQNIDPALYEAARIDGAPAWRRFVEITLPLLRPTLLVAVLFRALDAFRVFDVIYVLTGGGPGTATESVSIYGFAATMQNLRFGYGAAISMTIFGVTFVLALAYIRALRGSLEPPAA